MVCLCFCPSWWSQPPNLLSQSFKTSRRQQKQNSHKHTHLITLLQPLRNSITISGCLCVIMSTAFCTGRSCVATELKGPKGWDAANLCKTKQRMVSTQVCASVHVFVHFRSCVRELRYSHETNPHTHLSINAGSSACCSAQFPLLCR